MRAYIIHQNLVPIWISRFIGEQKHRWSKNGMNMEENIMPVNGAAVTVLWFTIRKKETAITVRHPAAG